MAGQTQDDPRLAARLEVLKGPIKSPRRVNPYLLAGITGLAGAGIGAYLVAFAPDPTPTGEVLSASTAREFQDGIGLDNFRPTGDEATALPQVAAPPPSEDLDALRATIARLEAQIGDLKAHPATVTDEAALTALRDQLAEVKAKATERDTAFDAIKVENDRLAAQLEAAALIGDKSDAESEAAARAADVVARREAELAKRRAEAEALATAQISSDMVAFRDSAGSNATGAGGTAGEGRTYTGDEAFLRAGATPSSARQSEVIANPSHTIMQGTLIEAALETAINSDLAGTIAAQVSQDVWSFDMSRVLIPRGSKLFGRYDSDVDLGQRRVLIAWDRLVTTDGQSVQLAAYGTDRIGRSGLPGKVRTHFLQRFGSAAVVSILGAAPAAVAANATDKSTADTVQNVGDNLNDSVGTVLEQYLTIAPTISVDQGAVVMVRIDADIELF